MIWFHDKLSVVCWYRIIWNDCDLTCLQASRSCGLESPLTRWRGRYRGSPPVLWLLWLDCVRGDRKTAVWICRTPPRTLADKRYKSCWNRNSVPCKVCRLLFMVTNHCEPTIHKIIHILGMIITWCQRLNTSWSYLRKMSHEWPTHDVSCLHNKRSIVVPVSFSNIWTYFTRRIRWQQVFLLPLRLYESHLARMMSKKSGHMCNVTHIKKCFFWKIQSEFSLISLSVELCCDKCSQTPIKLVLTVADMTVELPKWRDNA